MRLTLAICPDRLTPSRELLLFPGSRPQRGRAKQYFHSSRLPDVLSLQQVYKPPQRNHGRQERSVGKAGNHVYLRSCGPQQKTPQHRMMPWVRQNCRVPNAACSHRNAVARISPRQGRLERSRKLSQHRQEVWAGSSSNQRKGQGLGMQKWGYLLLNVLGIPVLGFS